MKDHEERFNLFEHRHRFASWAAARAVQRGFSISNVQVCKALESCGVVDFLRDPESRHVGQAEFDELHRNWCRTMIDYLLNHGVDEITFGRAAKMEAVYLKSMVVMSADADCQLASVVHPPIDRVLLQNLGRCAMVPSPYKRKWQRTTWTELDEREYYELVSELFACLDPEMPRWHLEEYWTVMKE